MTGSVVFDWKSFVAIGFGVMGVVLATKMTPEQAKELSMKFVDNFKLLRFLKTLSD